MEKKNNYHIFFITNNKGGMKTREKYLFKNFPEIYNDIIKYNVGELEKLPFKQKIWHFVNKVNNIPRCNECGKLLNFKKSLSEGYGKFCSLKCTNKNVDHISSSKNTRKEKESETLKKMKQTTRKRYGVNNYFQRKDLIKKSFNKKYGVDHVSKVGGVKEKKEQTNLKRYGVKNNLLLSKTQNKSNQTKSDNFLKNYSGFTFTDYKGKEIKLECNECGLEYQIDRTLFRYRVLNKVNPCTICNITDLHGVSHKENDLCKFIIDKGVEVIENDRSVIPPKELDIIIPSKKIAIEFNGLYWHSDLYVDKDYHLNKTLSCAEQGYDLIHIFEDEWLYKRDIVESIICNRLNINDKRIFGRKCVIKEISPSESKEFLNTNHIQGYVKSSVKIGLFYDDELVSVMTFGKNRISLGQKHKKNEWEMLRYSNKLNTTIVGGAGKLFKYFIKTYQPQKITSYSDNRYFNGGLYKKLGFDFIHNTTPNYWYVIKDKREHRFSFRKDILVKEGFDKNKTEKQIMSDRKINRIYDCGNKKWVWLK